MVPSPAQVEAPANDEAHFGFLTFVEDRAGGFLGGYLVVNHRGRPIEFHCTAPVVASRAEEILYGATLRTHLFCERLGAALLAKGAAKVDLVLVDHPESRAMADETPLPVVLVATATENTKVDNISMEDRPKVEQLLANLTRYVELSEPFERIVEAIREAGQLDRDEEASPTDEVERGEAA